MMAQEELKRKFKTLPLKEALALFQKNKAKIRCWNNHGVVVRSCKDGGCITDYEGELHHIICGSCILHMQSLLKWDEDG